MLIQVYHCTSQGKTWKLLMILCECTLYQRYFLPGPTECVHLKHWWRLRVFPYCKPGVCTDCNMVTHTYFCRKQGSFCTTFGSVILFLNNVIVKIALGRDLLSREPYVVCSFPQLPLGSLTIYFPHGATIAATQPPCRLCSTNSTLYGHGTLVTVFSPW